MRAMRCIRCPNDILQGQSVKPPPALHQTSLNGLLGLLSPRTWLRCRDTLDLPLTDV
ncbi:hypothetical protein A2U01_0070862, partial [Trifolium medium]|nr:hypothetical protein [Trifolium medium]